jgi:hypothetical protein
MVNGPVMLEIGMIPEVATATSSFIIVPLFTMHLFYY